MENFLQRHLSKIISNNLQSTISSIEFHAAGGGSINYSYQIHVNNSKKFFCKINTAIAYPQLFEKEKNGLLLLQKQNLIRVPHIIACEVFEEKQVLILEWIEQGLKTPSFWKSFGVQLAQLHGISNDRFGLHEDNYMGALQQNNKPFSDWPAFFIHQRLEPQIRLSIEKKLLDHNHVDMFEKLYKKLPSLFSSEPSSLLHGDLWSGNFLCDENSQPVLIDPAVYFGHRNMDLAMTTLFGGFDKSFYEAYQYYFHFPENYRQQWDICNLYPLLIHLNLFGKSYLADILHTLKCY